MFEQPLASPRVLNQGNETCPHVADLIGFAMGQLEGDERKRVETHLGNDRCDYCQSWIEKTTRLHQNPWPAKNSKNADSPSVPSSLPADRPANLEPISWQRQALNELEQRLRLLEEC